MTRKQPMGASSTLRVAILQRRLAGFRVPVFNRLASDPDIELTVITDLPAPISSEFSARSLPITSVSVLGREVTVQRSVLSEARKHDVIIVEGSIRFLSSVWLVAAKPLHRKPVLWWTSMHEPTIASVGFPDGAKGWLLSRVLTYADGVITYSQTAASLVQCANPAVKHITVAPNVLDTDVLVGAERKWLADRRRLRSFVQNWEIAGRPVILFVGRLIAEKQLPVLLRAFQDVRRQRRDLNPVLVIVGDGIERKPLEALAVELDIAPDVRFCGEIRDPESVCPFFLTAKALALPGSGGLAIYQALTHGVPVVATRADGTELDMVRDGLTGFLCEPGDVVALSRHILGVLELPENAWREISLSCSELARGDMHVESMIGALKLAAVDAARRGSEPGRVKQLIS